MGQKDDVVAWGRFAGVKGAAEVEDREESLRSRIWRAWVTTRAQWLFHRIPMFQFPLFCQIRPTLPHRVVKIKQVHINAIGNAENSAGHINTQ